MAPSDQNDRDAGVIGRFLSSCWLLGQADGISTVAFSVRTEDLPALSAILQRLGGIDLGGGVDLDAAEAAIVCAAAARYANLP